MTGAAPGGAGAAPGGAGESLAARLGGARVGLRADIHVSRHLFRGEPAYVLRDPVTFGSHRVSPREYRVLTHIRPELTLSEAHAELVQGGVLTAGSEETFYRFVFSLHGLGLLRLPVADESVLYRRHASRQAAVRKKWRTAVFFLQVPLVNPDAFLERTLRVGRVLFSRGFFALWCALVSTAVVLAVQNWGELARPIQQIAAGANLPAMFTALILLKVVHELGHAYACKHFGGRVPEMGVFLVVFAPCAYVDTSAAWGFTKKWQRLVVCLGGMYVELFIGALALLLWSVSSSPAVSAAAYNVALLSSIVTIGFNINPLMRFDGYYVLSDLIEVPNLRARATALTRGLIKRVALGVPRAKESASAAMQAFFVLFGVSSGIYKFLLVLGISGAIASRFFLVGLGLAGTYVVMEIFKLLRGLVPYLLFSPEARSARGRSLAALLCGAVVLPLLLWAVPLPSRVSGPAYLSAEHDVVVRTRRAGFLVELGVPVGASVERAAPLAHFADPEMDEERVRAREALDVALHRLRTAQDSEPAHFAREAERVRSRERELEWSLAQRAQLDVRAALPGTLVEGLNPSDIGRFFGAGEPVGRIVGGRSVVRGLLSQVQVAAARPRPGARVLFRPRSDPGRTLEGTIERVRPSGTRRIEAGALTHAGGGEIVVDPGSGEAGTKHFEVTVQLADDAGHLPYGMPGRMQLAGTPDSAGRLIWRRLVRFMNRMRHGV